MTDKQKIKKLLKENGYRGDEMLMYEYTGEVVSAREWAADVITWHMPERGSDVDEYGYPDQKDPGYADHYEEFVPVQWDEEKRDWVKV